MIELFTEEEYINKAREADRLNKRLYIHTFTQEVLEEQPVYELNGEFLKPVMIDVEEKVPTYDENGEQTGTTIIIKQVQKTEPSTVQKEYAELLIAENGYYVCYKDNYTDGTVTADFEANKLARLKQVKNAENTAKAKVFLNHTFTIEVGEDKTACDFIYNKDTTDNLNSSAIGFLAQAYETKQWTDENGITVQLTAEDVATILLTFKEFADAVWQKWGIYKQNIDQSETIEELESIEIDYENIDN